MNVFNKPETSRHPHINREDLGKVYDEAIKLVTDYIDKQTEKLHNYAKEDIVLNKLLTIYDGKVGEDFSTEDLLIFMKRVRFAMQDYCHQASWMRKKSEVKVYAICLET